LKWWNGVTVKAQNERLAPRHPIFLSLQNLDEPKLEILPVFDSLAAVFWVFSGEIEGC
jgi:hypothetical protein